MARVGSSVLLALSLCRGGLAQISAGGTNCEAMLMAQSQAMNSQCCSGSSHCDGGVPSDCNAACAAVFMPFWSQCQRFTEQNLPELVSFGRKCATASSGSPPPPPPSGGTPSAAPYLQATFSFAPGTVDLSSNKRKARFESNLRSDIGSALDIPSSAVLIDSDQGTSVRVDIFAASAREAQTLQQTLQSQLMDSGSELLSGTVTSDIQNPSGVRVTMGQAQNQQCGEAAWCAPNCCSTLDGGGSGVGNFAIFVDNAFDVHVNGEEIGSSDQWATHVYHFDAPCGDGNVYAIHGIDTGGPAAIIASVENCGSTTITSPAWKCVSENPGDGWTTQGFDDSHWPVATQGGLNGASPWGVRPGIGMDAHWIWAHNLQGTDEVWCRIVSGSHEYDDGMYANTEGHDNGQLHIGADDSATIYINGDEIGQTTIDQWDQTERFAFTAPCAQPTTYGFKVPDGAGVAGLIATINHCGEEANTHSGPRWKCSSSCDDGWEGVGFDDSSWNIASNLGINGNPPWSHHEVSDSAYWIWNGEGGQHGVQDDKGFEHDDRQACCRYVSDHRPINCNAARMRYTQDYLSITQCGGSVEEMGGGSCGGQVTSWHNNDGLGSQGYAASWNHYMESGQASGYIWHSELCNLDGTDIVANQQCSVHTNDDGSWGSGAQECGNVMGVATFSVDNGYDFYVNDQLIGSGNAWQHTDRFEFEADCDGNTVYGIDAYDEGGIASIIGTIYHCDEMILTSSQWKCAPRCAQECTIDKDGHETCGAGQATVGCTDTTFWTAPNGPHFDDSYWPPAADAGDNGVLPWGHRPDISGEAHWIWSADPDAHDAVRCRYESSHKAIDCPAAESRYWQDYNDVAAADVAAADVAGSIGMEAWDHFNAWGSMEGRIWHSELCNEDGTNKRSMCEVKHTTDQYEYDFLSQPLGPEKTITFSVKAANDAHIGFFNNMEHTGNARNVQDQYTIDLGEQYEVVICGWGGTQSVIREEAQGEARATVDTTGYLDENDFRQFWASAANGLIRVGAGNDVGTHVFLTFQDPNDRIDVNWAAVATGWGSEGDWVVCIPEKCTGTHDAVTARLSGMEVCDGCGNGCSGMCNSRDCAAGGRGCPAGSTVDDTTKYGFTGGGMVNPVNEAGDTMMFSLAACQAGLHSLGFVYQLAPGVRGGLTNMRSMNLNVNGKDEGEIQFTATGGWQEGDWRETFKQVQLQTGENIVALTTTGSEGPNFDSMEVTRSNGGVGVSASSHGVIHITADNGYILYVNGNRVGAGGSSMGAAHGQHTDWTHTDAWTFVDSCETPTTYAIHALDSEGIAAVIGDFTHCGQTIVTSDQWRCAPVTSMTSSDHGGMHLDGDRLDGSMDKQYVAGPIAMDFLAARRYCQTNYDDLASIHSAEEQDMAHNACAESGHNCWIGLNDQFREGRYTWTDGTTVDFMNWDAGEPNNSINHGTASGDEDVVAMYMNGKWHDNIEAGGGNGFVDEPGNCFLRTNCVLDQMAHDGQNCHSSQYTDANGETQTWNADGTEDCNPGNTWEVYMKSDKYATRHVGYNTWSGYGSDDDSDAISGHTPQTCQALCDDESTCSCIVFQVGQGNVPLCETADSSSEVALDGSLGGGRRIQYLGCFNDALGRDGDNPNDSGLDEGHSMGDCEAGVNNDGSATNGAGRCRDLNGRYFNMGAEAGPEKCAELCAGYAYFGLQFYNQCFCDNAGAMSERVPESDCDTPCQNGADDTAGASSTMCGGAWRNSVYALSTNYWESPGYDDRGWQSAADLGPNGVAPWYHRPNIADTANWIWSTDAGFNGGYDQTPGAGRVQIDPDGTHHNGGYDYGHIDSPGMESTDEYGNCFLRSNCNVDQMTTGNHWGSYPAWDVYIKSEGYAKRAGFNAWTDHGASDDLPPIPGLNPGSCQRECDKQQSCSCVVFQNGFESQAEGHDNVFCRFTAPNQEINCYAAQAKYLEDNSDAKDALYPAWLHYTDIGRAQGRAWPSEMCNICAETTRSGTHGGITTNCNSGVYNQNIGACFNQDGTGTDGSYSGGTSWMQNAQGAGVHHGVGEQFVESHSGEGFYTYEEGLTCTDKCRGVHDAAVAEMVGATSCHQTGDICHGGHYGLGFANFQNPTGDTVTFRLHACNAGKHRIAITYALANDDPPRPLDVQVNGVDAVGTTGGIATAGTSYQSGARGVNFPATGSWTVWGKVFVEGMFLDGENTVILRAVSNSGPNVDSIEVYPHDDSEIGSAFVDVDNEYNLYIDGHLIGSGSQWDSTDAYNFQASCDVPTVYAIHGIDYEHTAGVAGAGMVAEFNHCGEVIRTNTRWKCIASDLQNGAPPPPQWMQPTFDDSAWQVATSYGRNGDESNYWFTHMQRPADEIGPGAQWIWTSDGTDASSYQTPGSAHDDVFCRYVSKHEVINCKAAAIRYQSDYGTSGCERDVNCDSFTHFRERGKLMGRIWHSELCGEECTYVTASFDWVDATRGSPIPMGDDDQKRVELPFPFPFYGQVKREVTISSNGFLTFSGDHHSNIPGHSPWGGESSPIPSPMVPNDMVAAFWSDLNPSAGGNVYTTTSTHCAHGIANGNICCVATCGQCGGSGCQNRPGGRAHCCSGTVRDSAVRCSQNGGAPPCVSDGNAFTVEWSDVPYYSGVHQANPGAGQQTMFGGQSTSSAYDGGTNHFEVTLFSDGKIKFQYKDMTPNPNAWAEPSVGVENAGGSEGMQISYADPQFPRPNTAFVVGKTCGRSKTMFSVGWCPNYCPGSDAANCPGVTLANTCDQEYGDRFCQDNYGGQLASIEDQQDYDRLVRLLPNDQTPNQFGTVTGNEKYMLGMHADPRSCGTGKPQWDYTDGTPADMDFLARHSQDGLTCDIGGSNHLVYTASYQDNAGHSTIGCDPTNAADGHSGCGLHDCCTGSIISGFVCEFYAAPGSIGIGLAQQFDDAEEMCQKEFGGHLLSIHDQQTMDKLTTLTTGYTAPVLVGLRSDGAGNWEWADQTTPNMDFLKSISADQLEGINEDQTVIFGGELHDWGQRNGASTNGGPFAYACGAWGNCAVPTTECNPLAHCNTCQANEEYEMGSANVNDCLTCQQGYRFVLQFPGDCTGTCEPVLDNAAHYVGGMNINNVNGADSRYQGMTAAVDWVRAAHNKRVPDPQEGRGFAMPWEWRSGEKTLEQCRHECLQHAECVGIEFCGPDSPDSGGKHDCDQNECILLSSALDGNPAQGWNVYTHQPAGTMGGGH